MGAAPRSGDPSGRRVVLGLIGAPFGVQGWIKVTSYTDPPEAIAGYDRWRVGPAGQEFEVRGSKRAGRGQVAVQLAGLQSPEAARGLTGLEVWVERSALRELPAGEYYRDDLVGLEAFSVQGVPLGRIEGYIELPAHPVAVLRGDRERLVPLVPGRLVAVDLGERRVTFDWHPDD
jgi:16S rRNA processing protein RimM